MAKKAATKNKRIIRNAKAGAMVGNAAKGRRATKAFINDPASANLSPYSREARMARENKEMGATGVSPRNTSGTRGNLKKPSVSGSAAPSTMKKKKASTVSNTKPKATLQRARPTVKATGTTSKKSKRTTRSMDRKSARVTRKKK